MTPSLEGWPTKAKEARSPHEVRLAPLDTNPVLQCLGEVHHVIKEKHGGGMMMLITKLVKKLQLWKKWK